MIVSRRLLHNSHALHFKVDSLGHCIQDNRKGREEKFARNGSNDKSDEKPSSRLELEGGKSVALYYIGQ